MKLEHAESVAARAILALIPFCERVEVAGGVRRAKPHIHDLELVAIPKWEVRRVEMPAGLFTVERPVNVNLLHDWACSSRIEWIIAPKPEGRNYRGTLATSKNGVPFNLDLYLTTPDRWGATFVLRTGSKEFGHALVTHAPTVGCEFYRGAFLMRGVPVSVPEETDVFDFLQLEYVPPEARTDKSALRAFIR